MTKKYYGGQFWEPEPFYLCPECESNEFSIVEMQFYKEEKIVDLVKECEDCGYKWKECYDFYSSTTLDNQVIE